jgi:hypothetical protein
MMFVFFDTFVVTVSIVVRTYDCISYPDICFTLLPSKINRFFVRINLVSKEAITVEPHPALSYERNFISNQNVLLSLPNMITLVFGSARGCDM